jgi:GDP-L-fucose synthase
MKKLVLITGGNGLVGSAIKSIRNQYPNLDFYYTTHKEVDLTNQKEVEKLFDDIKPNYVIHTAARVGGIGKNLASPAEQYYHNILMNTFVIDEAYRHNVEKLLAFSSVCAFPNGSPVIKESILHDGPPFSDHGSYAHSKRMVDVQIRAYRKQYNTNGYGTILPVNIFGECDNYDLEQGHVVPSLIHRCFISKKQKIPLKVWGTGVSRREFCYAKDLAKVCCDLLESDMIIPELLIVSESREYTIKEIVNKISKAFNFEEIEWLVDKPNGQLSRPSDTTLFKSIYPNFKWTDIDEAIEKSVRWFEENYPNVRRS